MKFILLALGIITTSLSFAQTSTFRSDDLNFAVTYPANWQKLPATAGVPLHVTGTLNGRPVQLNVGIIEHESFVLLTTAEYAKVLSSEEFLREATKEWTHLRMLNFGLKTKLAGKPALLIHYSGVGRKDGTPRILVTRQTIRKNRLYTVTIGAHSSDFPGLEKELNALTDSFTFIR